MSSYTHTIEDLLICASIKKYKLSDIPEKYLPNGYKMTNIANELQKHFDEKFIFVSAFRDAEHSRAIPASLGSTHCRFGAIDLHDPTGKIRMWLMDNPDFMVKHGIYMEDPYYTKTWCHITIIAPQSKKLAFIPYAGECKNPDNRFKAGVQPIQKHITNTTISNKTMSSPIIKTLIDKGIDIGTSFIPGGSLLQSSIKSIAKSLLGTDTASEDEVKQAIQNATPEQLQLINAELNKLNAEIEKEKQDTQQEHLRYLQEVEKTAQREFDTKDKLLHFIERFFYEKPVKSLIVYTIFYYSSLSIFTIYALWQQGYFSKQPAHDLQHWEFIEHCIIGLMIIYPTIPVALLFKPIYNIVEAISQSITAVISAPKKAIGYIDSTMNGIGSIVSKAFNK